MKELKDSIAVVFKLVPRPVFVKVSQMGVGLERGCSVGDRGLLCFDQRSSSAIYIDFELSIRFHLKKHS